MLAAGIFGVDIRQSMAFQLFAITASLLFASVLASLSFRGQFRIRRLLPQFGTVNQPLTYQVQIENLGKNKQSDLLFIDDLEGRLPDYHEFSNSRDPQDRNRNRFDRIIGYPRLMGLIRNKRGGSIQPLVVESIAADDNSELNIELLPLRRGYIHFSIARIARPDPFGLVRAMKKFKQKNKLLILPKTYRTPKIELKGLRKYQQGGMNQASSVGDSQEFMSLRDYRPGDPLRSIHWRSYAKTGSPVVKEFHDEFFVRQGLILDTFQEDKSNDVFEEAVSVAASFCLSLPGQDALLDLIFVGDRPYRFTSGRGLGQTENMLEILACTRPCDDSSFSKLHDLIPAYSSETSGMICVLLDWDEKRQRLVEAIIQAGIPVVVFVLTDANNALDLEPGPLKLYPERFINLSCGQVQTALDQANKFNLAKE
jgi:uncharacterized protein (DUF58 family)